MSPLSEKAKKELTQTQAKFIYWVAYGITFSVVAFPFILLASINDQYRFYIMPVGIGIAGGLAPVGANAAGKRIR